ncbi:hypothetical protein J2W48_001684 [Flavobacterium piscis]|uniref:Uncharacterized protein n=1 Tax=Flavobacterium piscis TaxID=1114874 RepID=A0ABU1Y8D9_9FLAO|nr:hypothetical protein [Flavobacterium piscis]
MINIRPELKTILFFIGYFIIAYLCDKISPSGPCAPGIGAFLFLLSIPISIIYTLILFFKYYKSQNKEYLNCVYIISGLWVIFFIILNFHH